MKHLADVCTLSAQRLHWIPSCEQVHFLSFFGQQFNYLRVKNPAPAVVEILALLWSSSDDQVASKSCVEKIYWKVGHGIV